MSKKLKKELVESVKYKNTNKTLFIIKDVEDVNSIEDKNENNLLHLAIVSHDASLVKLLISKGIDINKKNILGYTPLHYAFVFEYYCIAKILLDNNADINIKDKKENTPADFALFALAVRSSEPLIDLIKSNKDLLEYVKKHGDEETIKKVEEND